MTTENEENNKTGTAAKPKKTKASAKTNPEPQTAGSTEITGATTESEVGTNMEAATPGKNETQMVAAFTVEIKKEDIEKKFNEALDKYAADIKLPGFRAGKAPMEIIKSRFKDSVREEVINQLLNDAFMEKVEKDKLKVISKPTIKKLDYEEGKDLKADVEIQVIPQIQLPDLDTLEVEIPLKDLQHEPFDEQKALNRLLEANKRQVPVTGRGVKENDLVMLKYQSKILATKKMDRTKSDYYIAINNANFEIIDLYDDILGKNIHDQLTLKRSYPADYKKKVWAGKEVEHHIEIEKILEMVKPDLDEKFFKSQGVKDEAELKQRMQNEHEEHVKLHLEEKRTGFIFDKLNECINFPLPQPLLEEEMTRILKENPYQYIFNHQDENEKKKAFEKLRTNAEKSLRFSFIMEAVKDKFNLKVTSEDLEKQCKIIAENNHLEFREVRNFYMKPENMAYLEENLLKIRVLDLLREKIKIKEV